MKGSAGMVERDVLLCATRPRRIGKTARAR